MNDDIQQLVNIIIQDAKDTKEDLGYMDTITIGVLQAAHAFQALLDGKPLEEALKIARDR